MMKRLALVSLVVMVGCGDNDKLGMKDGALPDTALPDTAVPDGGRDGAPIDAPPPDSSNLPGTIIVTPTAGLITTELGGTATFTVRLGSMPSADVLINLSSNMTDEGTVSPAALTFTSINFATAQTVTVTGVNDTVADGSQSYSIVTAPAISADSRYMGVNASDVAVTNTDDDSPNVIVTPSTRTITENAGTGTFVFTLTTMPTASVTFPIFSAGAPGDFTLSAATVTLDTANWNTGTGTGTITVTGVNDAIDEGVSEMHTLVTGAITSTDPVYGATGAGAIGTPDPILTITDDDTAGVTVTPTTITASETAGSRTATFVVTGNSDPGTNPVSITLTASSPADVTSIVPATVMLTSANFTAGVTVTVTVADDSVNEGTETVTIQTGNSTSSDPLYNGLTVADVMLTITDNDGPPVIAPATGSLNYNEGSGPLVVDNSFTITDPDSTTLMSVTVTLTNAVAGQDELGCTQASPVACPAISTTGSLQLTGAGTLAQYQAVLRTVTYNNTSAAPDTTGRNLTVVANDGTSNSNTATRTITINGSNNLPVVLPATGTVTHTEGQGATVMASGLTVTDADDGTLDHATVTITNFVAGQDTLGCVPAGPVTCNGPSTTGSLSLTGAGTPAQYAQVLASATYTNTSDNPTLTARNVEFQVFDSATTSTTVTRTVDIVAGNDAPTLTPATDSLSHQEGEGFIPIAATIVVADVDSANLTGATVTITNFVGGEDVLGCTQSGPVTCAASSTTGTLALTGTGTLAEYQTVLRTLTYDNTSATPNATTRTITISVTDGTDAGSATRNMAIGAVNNPVMVTPATGNVMYTEGDAPVAIAPGIVVTDVDSPTLSHAIVAITGGLFPAQDRLRCTPVGPVSCPSVSATGSITLTGPGTPAEYSTALAMVTYDNVSEAPSNATRNVVITVFDAGTGTAVTRTITVVPVNDAPVLSPDGTTTAYTEGGAAVAFASDLVIADIDSPSFTNATIMVPGATDVLHCTSAGAITCSATVTGTTLTLTGAGSPADYQSVLRGVTYETTDNNPNSTPRVLTITVNDSGTMVSVTRNVVITPSNDRPTVTYASPTITFTEGGGAIVPSGVISDPDDTSLDTVAVGLDADFDITQDTVTCTPTPPVGCSFLANGSWFLTGPATVAEFNAALANVTFNNNSDDPLGTREWIIVPNDGSGFGPLTTRTIIMQGVNDAPLLSTPQSQPTLSSTARTISPPIVVSDLDSTTATVSLSSGLASTVITATAQGGAAVTGSGTSTLTVSGSIGDVNNTLATAAASVTGEPQTVITVNVTDGGSPAPALMTSGSVTFDVFDATECLSAGLAGHTYFLCGNSRISTSAANLCGQRSASLASINNATENAFLAGGISIFGVSFWIGLDDNAQEGCFQWTDGSGSPDHGVGGQAHTCATTAGFQFWGAGEPNNSGGENCTEMFSTHWNDVTCGASRATACEHPRL